MTICHAASGKYVTITVPIDFSKGNGHLGHAGDIIPGPPGQGVNWDAEGVATLLNGCVRTRPADTDRDGVLDIDDRDDDGDGVLDERDLDDDGDGIADASDEDQDSKRDTDRDGVPDSVDQDDDGDGIADVSDPDRDGDSVPDTRDRDLAPLPDTDSDGTPDVIDADDDGDSVPDAVDADRDGDLIPDVTDDDADNDGTPDDEDADDDGDGTPDVVDTDADGDSIDDAVENGSTAGSLLVRSGRLASSVPGLCAPPSTTPGSSNPGSVDSDQDGLPDVTDLDDDGDGIDDTSDGGQANGPDADRDGVPDAVDSDDNGDGLVDAPSATSRQPVSDPSTTDSDGDGQPNSRDADDDGDGVPDARDGDADGDGVAETVTQMLSGSRALPRVLDADGRTIVLDSPAITNARQLATVAVSCTSGQRGLRAKPTGDVRPTLRSCAVRTVGDRTILMVDADGPTAVTVRLSAAARGEYRAVEQVRTYVVG